MKYIKTNRSIYKGKNLDYISFPMGGIGTGMICLDGNGCFSHISLRHKPNFQKYASYMFAAFNVKNIVPRILEGPVPDWKTFSLPEAGNGLGETHFGLPRCNISGFSSQFPFAVVNLVHPELPIKIDVCGWSPFIPVDADNSSLPVAAVEYMITNTSEKKISGTFSFHSKNLITTEMQQSKARSIKNGFVLYQNPKEAEPHLESHFAVQIPDEKTTVIFWEGDGGYSTRQLLWKDILNNGENGCEGKQNFIPGASLYVKLDLEKRQSKTVKVLFSWYVPFSDVKMGTDQSPCYQPWYSARFKSIEESSQYWLDNYELLKEKTRKFSTAFYNSDIPPIIKDAIGANLGILKSPTVLRQTDGRLWCWEGCCESCGCCAGSCTHVWNYCQAIAHLFPSLERSLRMTEFNENQDEKGHQQFRALLPIRQNTHDFHAAADGQLGGIMKIYREWRISGDTQWLRNLWPKVKQSLEYCINTWDPEHNGYLKFPHHNTYDIEFWGPDSMCCSFYAGALKAASIMAEHLNQDATLYKQLYLKSKHYIEKILFNGEYFEQKVMWKYPNAPESFDEEQLKSKYILDKIVKIIKEEGPLYQYGKGCLTDGVLGAWLAEMCGLGEILDSEKIKKHLMSIYKYNFRKDLSNHPILLRPGFAFGKDGGVILCTWPKGKRPTIPMIYCDEIWTGFEYQFASHLISHGFIKEGLNVVETARKRHDGTKRNPFDEYECGHWYGRALSSYGLLLSYTGFRYDAMEKTLYFKRFKKRNFKVFFCTDGGWGIAGIKNNKPFVQVLHGNIDIKKIEIIK